MKSILLLFFLGISTVAIAQKSHIVTTEDGRKVILKPDFTWEYLDAKTAQSLALAKTDMPKSGDDPSCQLPENFKEPKLSVKIQNQLKRGHSAIEDIKEKVAKDNEVPVSDVILVSASEQRTKGEYHFCVKGKKQVYKRLGNSIMKKRKLF